MIQSLIYLLIIGFVLWIIIWAIDYMGAPQPFNKILKGIVVLVGIIFLINFLMQFAGGGGFIRMN